MNKKLLFDYQIGDYILQGMKPSIIEKAKQHYEKHLIHYTEEDLKAEYISVCEMLTDSLIESDAPIRILEIPEKYVPCKDLLNGDASYINEEGKRVRSNKRALILWLAEQDELDNWLLKKSYKNNK